MSIEEMVAENQKTKSLALEFPSKPEKINEVETFVSKVQNLFKFREELFGNILVAITEAVNNAIFHGNKSDTNKQVAIRFLKNNGHLEFLIADEGNGFDYKNLPDPTSPENIEKPTGRGVFLMRNLADHCEFLNNGNTVKLKFKI